VRLLTLIHEGNREALDIVLGAWPITYLPRPHAAESAFELVPSTGKLTHPTSSVAVLPR
jgi:hypothetical protein